jgi:hypothetical protein
MRFKPAILAPWSSVPPYPVPIRRAKIAHARHTATPENPVVSIAFWASVLQNLKNRAIEGMIAVNLEAKTVRRRLLSNSSICS